MPRLSDQILFLIAFGHRLTPQLGTDYSQILPQDHRAVGRALSRMLSRGEIKRNHELTAAGKNRVLSTWPQHSAFSIKPSAPSWDGKWRVVMFDIPERYRGLRAILRRFLTNLGFAGMQRSLWITPFSVTPEVVAFLEASRLNEMVLVMEVDKLANVKPQQLAAATWKLHQLTQKYQDLSEDCAASDTLTKSLQQALVKAVFTDPFLPQALEPESLTQARSKALHAFSLLEKA